MTGVDEIIRVLQGVDKDALKKELEEVEKEISELTGKIKELKDRRDKIKSVLRVLGVSTSKKGGKRGVIRSKIIDLANQGMEPKEIVETLLEEGLGSPTALPGYVRKVLREEGFL